MKKVVFCCILLTIQSVFSQTDFSDSWEDYYSYNTVKQIEKVDNVIYALSDNAVFTYNEDTEEIQKISSVNGLSGETTSSFHYSKTFDKLIIGYENGLIEILDKNGTISVSPELVNFTQASEKNIKNITEVNNKLLISTPFAILEYDIEKEEFGDTFFIGKNSSEVIVNKTIIFENNIYAATENGLYVADATSNLLVDFNLWNQFFENRKFSNIVVFNNDVFLSEGKNLFKFSNNSLELVDSFNQDIEELSVSIENITITLNSNAILLDRFFNRTSTFSTNSNFDFSLNGAFLDNNNLYLATNEFGLLKTNINTTSYEEIHPDGPLSNEVFSIDVLNNNLWVVYGGYNISHGLLFKEEGFSHFNGEQWINTPYDSDFPVKDLNFITIDPNTENRVYISSYGDTRNINSVSTGGLLVVENNEIKTFYNHLNSGLEDLESTIPDRVTIRISGTAFDNQGNLWVTNSHRERELKKLSPSGNWTAFDLSEFRKDPRSGLNEIAVDRNNTIWIGSRSNGVYVFNENGDRKTALTTAQNNGNLPDQTVLTVAVDRNNIVWMGTRLGMVVYRNASAVFDTNTLSAQPVIIEENGIGERLLGDQRINSIAIDGADNKWFGTDSGGVLYTNPSGQNTLANFSKENSPLPSNRILKIRVDKNNGKVYFATDKGIVAYNSNVAPFGETLGEVYAYPNPALKNHETVTITGRNNTNLPQGTNVKILDIAGNLVYETNVVEGQELQGGKVVWNKRNLAGKKVASGVYLALLSNEDASENSIAKIAIIN